MLFAAGSSAAKAQTTIAQQDFETSPASPVWTISSGAGQISTATGSGDVPSNQRIRGGTRSWQVSFTTATLVLNSVSTLGYASIKATVRLSSTAPNSSQGNDALDQVKVSVALNGGSFPVTPDITISGNNNARWSYNNTINDQTSAGTPISSSGTSGTNAGTIHSTLVINVPNGTASLSLRIVANNDAGNEIWNVDDVSLTGTPVPTLLTSSLTAFGNGCVNSTYGPNSFTITGLNLTTADVTVGALNGYTYGTTSGGTYTSSLSLSHAAGSYSQQIFVKFTPDAPGSFDGNIAIGGGGAPSINTAASGTGIVGAPVISSTSSNSPVCEDTPLTLGVVATGPSLSYQWSGTGTITNGTTANASVTNMATGNYHIAVTNACGTADEDVAVTVIPLTAWYEDADADGYGDPAVDSLSCDQPAGYVADNTDDCPTVFGLNGDSCDDGNPFTSGDVLVACVCIGTPAPCDNWTLTINTDASGNETTWQMVDATSPFILDSGGPYPSNSSIIETICVPQGACFDLTFNDSGNNGINPGGWVLRDQNGKRVIDNFGNGSAFTSTATPDREFCSPVGIDAITGSGCDKLDWLPNDYIVANPNPAVSAQWMIGNQTDDGYQFWFFDPTGGYSRRILHTHAQSMGFGPPSATRACHMPVSFTPFPIPFNTLLNVRVRSLVNGVFSDFGAACRFMLLPAPPACPTTQLDNNPLHAGTTMSCGVSGKVVGASGYPGKLWANIVSSATHYRWLFEVPSEGYIRQISTSSYFVTLGAWTTNPLLCGTFTYDVSVAVSVDGGANYCPFGPVCTVGITNGAPNPCTAPFGGGGGSLHLDLSTEAEFILWPNPNRGEQLHLELSSIDQGVRTMYVEVHDIFGKRVHQAAIPVEGSEAITSVLNLNDPAGGLYMVTVVAGDDVYQERLMIQ